ncbi:sterol 24-C-methyltransferase [Fragilaria crotonensis]|nr:sterol 24-C-methyltransferase [Fragilaria crotonensis]
MSTLRISLGAKELALGATATLAILQLVTPMDPVGRCMTLLKQLNRHERKLKSSSDVNSGIDRYLELHQENDEETRNAEYKTLVDSYYDLATLFYEWGWGSSFHFAYRYAFESFSESIRRHEYYLASKLGLVGSAYTNKILDVGCGIGGPMRNICRFTLADVTGLTLNQYQVDRGNELCDEDDVVRGHCRSVQGDFMQMPFEHGTFDGAYAIEATCHAPDRVGVYSEVYRVLKPGAIFACYEWCMTDKYIPGDPAHERAKKKIEEGDGLPSICHTSVCLQAMIDAGFEMLEERDCVEDNIGKRGKVWHLPLLLRGIHSPSVSSSIGWDSA